uniref:Uncharacterized protein n=1 Tax=Pristionchus pacificus TaxID=54126 RepID=A0A2A6CJY7_PRIPA|eukprot:PDM78439.1 hypothetical protein PRIPAC_31018 [Pristionchus pacificus]
MFERDNSLSLQLHALCKRACNCKDLQSGSSQYQTAKRLLETSQKRKSRDRNRRFAIITQRNYRLIDACVIRYDVACARKNF